MGKRFTATEKWEDPFFCEIEAKYKLAWICLLDKCDNAGIYDVNIRALSFFVGFDFTPEELLKTFKDRIVILNGGSKWFIPKFIEFQYGILTRECYPHRPVIDKLNKYGLLENKGNNRVVTTLQEKEKEKEKNKEKEKDSKYSSSFLKFWEAYPRKEAKGKAYQSFKSLKITDEQLSTIISSIEKYKNTMQWKKDNGEFIPHPATWLNQSRWEDEPESKPVVSSGLTYDEAIIQNKGKFKGWDKREDGLWYRN